MKYQYQNNTLYFYFYADFDYMSIAAIKAQVIDLINEKDVQTVIFDLEDITFVDSTGIGFVIARYKQCASKKAELQLSNLANEHRIIFEMSGVFQIIKLIDNEVKL